MALILEHDCGALSCFGNMIWGCMVDLGNKGPLMFVFGMWAYGLVVFLKMCDFKVVWIYKLQHFLICFTLILCK